MKRTVFQHPELRDENDNIIQAGTYGKESPLVNSTNDGVLDYINNNLMYLYDNTMGGTGGEINTETITGKTGTITNLTATTVKAGTVTADALNGPLTGNVTGTATRAIKDGNGKNIASTYLPAVVGAVVAFAGSTIPTGWLLCDGSAVSRTDYAALFAVIGTTYGTGNGSTTFNLPNLVDKFVEGSATAGTVKSAGLPNITGIFRRIYTYATQASATGALSLEFYATNNGPYKNGETNNALTISLDASRSNSIYGKSDTVQPPALTMRYIIKY